MSICARRRRALQHRLSRFLAVVAAAVLAASVPAFAQVGRTQIGGVVVDANKGVLPGAVIVAVNDATGLVRTATSGPEGRFTIPTLPPGTYTLRVEMPGFQTQTQPGVVAGVGQEITLAITMHLQGLSELVTVSAQTPLIEVTSSKLGEYISNREIDNLPSQGRSQLSLMQLVPGLTPSLAPGTFEGGQFNANGRDTGSNLFLLDGAYNNDDRQGGAQGTQARVTLDTMAEYQVLTHQYPAEYGGSSGVIVNAVTRSGSNQLSGRTFWYYRNNALNSTDYFLKQAGEKNQPAASKIYGGGAGGPLVKNRAFWFANLERTVAQEAANLSFPAEAAPVAVSYAGTTDIKALNSFVRTDLQPGMNQSLSFRWLREAAPTVGEDLEANLSTPDNVFIENDTGDQIFNGNWTSIIGSQATHELRISHVRENLLQGGRAYFDDSLNFIELNGRDQFDIGSENRHPDFAAGPKAAHGSARLRTFAVDDAVTYLRSGWGDHTFKAGFSYSRNLARPQIVGANDNGTFTFLNNVPFDPANPVSYPSRFSMRLGEIYFDLTDWRGSGYVQDKWQVDNRLTLNLGLRYDYQHLTPQTKDAFGPRVGLAYDLRGTGRTLLRAGFGKFYEYQLLTVASTLAQGGILSPSFLFDTGEDRSASAGVVPAHACLQPAGRAGLALISGACRALLTGVRDRLAAGTLVNTEPTIDGDRKLGYLWSFSAGVEHELLRNLAVSADYVGNRGNDQTALVDINEPVNGVRPGVNGFDPDGRLIPAGARTTVFQRVLQLQTRDEFNSDYDALELALERRHAQRWSGRVSYTLSRARDVGTTSTGINISLKRVSDDRNPRSDYGRANFDNRHALAMSGHVEIWRGLSGGTVFRYYSGYPITELVGVDVNRDRDTLDRPVAGVDDAARPIESKLDGNGRAVRNGIDGEGQLILDGRLQYKWRVRRHEVGWFLEVYNATNHVNFGNPSGNRRSANFMVPIVSNDPRTVQLGLRLTF
jgi:outer membrane receptor protein involved in Fe transport